MEKTGAQILTQDDFDLSSHKLNKSVNYFLIFYAPWCPHCQAQVKNVKYISKVLKMINQDHQPFKIGIINGDENQNLLHKLNIQGFPTYALTNSQGKLSFFQGLPMVEAMADKVSEIEEQINQTQQFIQELFPSGNQL